MKVAALDLGSNSFLLTIAERAGEGSYKVVHDESRVTRLGQQMEAIGAFHPDALKRAEEAFESFSSTIQSFGVTEIRAMATSAARDASNGHELINLGQRYGIPIQIISGDEEAALTFKGAGYNISIEPGSLVLDIGGGSTEFISDDNDQYCGVSLNIGTVRMTERYITNHPVSNIEIQNLKKGIQDELSAHEHELPKNAKKVVAVAGTPTTISSVIQMKDFDFDSVHGSYISLSDLNVWLEKLRDMTVEERLQLKGMQPGRADVIVAGLCILIECIRHYGLSGVVVSAAGVRYGLIAQAFEAVR